MIYIKNMDKFFLENKNQYRFGKLEVYVVNAYSHKKIPSKKYMGTNSLEKAIAYSKKLINDTIDMSSISILDNNNYIIRWWYNINEDNYHYNKHII